MSKLTMNKVLSAAYATGTCTKKPKSCIQSPLEKILVWSLLYQKQSKAKKTKEKRKLQQEKP